MNTKFHHLANHPIAPGTTISQSPLGKSPQYTMEDPALSMMSDFYHIRPFSIPATATIEQINSKMIACGVRLLFVSDAKGLLLGLITFNDIFGEIPVRYIQEHGGKRDEIQTQDIMTPLSQLEALLLSEVTTARIGQVVETFKISGRQHLLVADERSDGAQVIAGLFSSTEIAKKLGIEIDVLSRANTFADVERALSQ
jgi:CBS domain containing-hemolysin-like protein